MVAVEREVLEGLPDTDEAEFIRLLAQVRPEDMEGLMRRVLVIVSPHSTYH